MLQRVADVGKHEADFRGIGLNLPLAKIQAEGVQNRSLVDPDGVLKDLKLLLPECRFVGGSRFPELSRLLQPCICRHVTGNKQSCFPVKIIV
jgi:hypothetical protein